MVKKKRSLRLRSGPLCGGKVRPEGRAFICRFGSLRLWLRSGLPAVRSLLRSGFLMARLKPCPFPTCSGWLGGRTNKGFIGSVNSSASRMEAPCLSCAEYPNTSRAFRP
jgi:hypothetical protein